MNCWATKYLRTKTATWAGRVLPSALLGHFPAAWATEGGYAAGIEERGSQLNPDEAARIDPDTFPYAGLGHGLAQMARVALPAAVGGAIGHSIDPGGHGVALGMLGGGVAASPWLYQASKARGMADVDKAIGAPPVDMDAIDREIGEDPNAGRVQTVEQSAPDYGAKLRALMERQREPS